jgi:lipopolysaccharide/colanic/teichoic acid biosynthesis glycosyltransferase
MLIFQGPPVVFSQIRSGKNFKSFKIFKLRTMKLATEDELGLTKGLRDERITKLGFFLRKYKIDEIPQLINVLKNDMSIVGSRPQVPFYTQKFNNYYAQILLQKPGLLSQSAIEFSNEDEILDQVDNPVAHYEEVLIPIKCKMDIALVNNFNVKTYFFTIFDYCKKNIFKIKNET